MPSAIKATPEQSREFALKDYHGLAGAKQARGQEYGRYGSPWGQVPPELEDHLRRLTGMNAAHMRMEAGLQDLPEGKERRPSPYWAFDQGPDLQRAEGVQLVFDGTGYIWTGWQDDPEYRAYIEGVSAQRQSAAKGRLTEGAPHWSTQLLQRREGKEATQIADLFGALGEQEPGQRFGQTEATRGGAYGGGPSSAGYLGMESARQAPGLKRAGYYKPKGSE